VSGYVCIAMLEDPPYNMYMAATDKEPEDWCAGLPLPSHLLCYEKFNDPEDFVRQYAKALLVCAISVIEGKAFPAPPYEVIRCFMSVRDKALQEGGVDLLRSSAKTIQPGAAKTDPKEAVQILPNRPWGEARQDGMEAESPEIGSMATAKDYPDEAIDYDIFEFTRHKGYAVLTRYIGFEDTSIIIPSRWKRLPVKIIGKFAFAKAIDVCHIKLKEGIEIIENGAFSKCSKLESIKLPDTLKLIGEAAFQECSSLNEIVIPPLIDRIMEGTFWDCSSLHKVTLPEQIEEIQKWAFAGCKRLDSIEFPSSIRRIGEHAFYSCEYLKKVEFKEGLKDIGYEAFGACIRLVEAHIPSSVTNLGTSIFTLYYPPQLTVFCKPGSTIQAYCRDDSIKCAKAG